MFIKLNYFCKLITNYQKKMCENIKIGIIKIKDGIFLCDKLGTKAN